MGHEGESSGKVHFASDHSILITFGRAVSPEAQRSVARLCLRIRTLAPAAVRNLHPAYNSVLVSFDPRRIGLDAMAEAASAWLERMGEVELPPPRRITIPVCYGAHFGPDLDDVAACTGMTPEEVVRAHSRPEYQVCFLGFSPGFPYLSGLPDRLSVPRLATPRTRVPAGSVAIGGSQTGVYPISSPGGWRILGRTPRALFRPEAEPPALLQMGDLVRFDPIPEAEFHRILGES